MRNIKAQLTDGTQVRILEVVNQNKPIKDWLVKIINDRGETYTINISRIQILGGSWNEDST